MRLLNAANAANAHAMAAMLSGKTFYVYSMPSIAIICSTIVYNVDTMLITTSTLSDKPLYVDYSAINNRIYRSY